MARRSSRTSRSSSLTRAFSSLVTLPRRPESTSVCRTHFRSVSGEHPIFSAIGQIASVLAPVLEDHPYRSLPNLLGRPARSCHDSILSRNGASGNLGAIQVSLRISVQAALPSGASVQVFYGDRQPRGSAFTQADFRAIGNVPENASERSGGFKEKEARRDPLLGIDRAKAKG